MRRTLAFLIVFIALTAPFAHAQELVIPKGYKLEAPEDYAKYHEKIIEITRWMEVTPITREVAKHREAKAFLMQWITGSPTVTISLRVEYIELFKKNPSLMTVFFGGWSSYVIENPEDTAVASGALAGMNSMLKAYQLDGMKRDKRVEKILKMQKQGTLEAWLKEMDEQ